MIRRLEYLSCEEKLGKLVLFSLEMIKVQGDLLAAIQYLKGAYKKDGERHFINACSDKKQWF